MTVLAHPVTVSRRLGPPLAALAALLGGSILAAVALLGFQIPVLLLLLGLILAVACWTRPHYLVILLLALLPFHNTLIAALRAAGFEGIEFLMVQLWKEALALVLVARALWDIARGNQRFRADALDLAIGAFAAIGILYLIVPRGGLDESLMVRAQGFRADVFALLLYFAGRHLLLPQDLVRRSLTALLVSATVVALLAPIQAVLPGPVAATLSGIGAAEFRAFQLGDESATGQGLIETVEIEGESSVRSGSFFLSYLGLTFFLVLLTPLAAALFLSSTGRMSRLPYLATVILVIGAVATLTRSAILLVGLELIALAALSRRPLRLALVLPPLAALALPLALYQRSWEAIGALLRQDDSSLTGHIDGWAESLRIMSQDTLGLGLGTAGTVSQRFLGGQGLTNESWYFQLSTEMGIASAVAFLIVMALALAGLYRVFSRSRDETGRALSMGLLVAGGALTLEGLILHVWQGAITPFIFWLLVGLALRERPADAGAQALAGPPPSPPRESPGEPLKPPAGDGGRRG